MMDAACARSSHRRKMALRKSIMYSARAILMVQLDVRMDTHPAIVTLIKEQSLVRHCPENDVYLNFCHKGRLDRI